jgi:hypothetical protein
LAPLVVGRPTSKGELSFHIEERVADMVRSGVSEEDARRRVRLEFGAAEQVKDECRDVRPARWVETFVQDTRCAWRNLRCNPGFAAVAVAMLALGIGGLTAMFSDFDTILIRPLPYADPDRLVMVWDDLSKTDDRTNSFPAPAEWYEWRGLNTVFTDIASAQPSHVAVAFYATRCASAVPCGRNRCPDVVHRRIQSRLS